MNESCAIRIGNQTAFSAANLMEPFEYALASVGMCLDIGHANLILGREGVVRRT